MSNILLVRHGQASFGQQDYDKLSPLGIIQVQLLGHHYAKLQRPITQITSGTLSRQQNSAKHFYNAYIDGIDHNSLNNETREHLKKTLIAQVSGTQSIQAFNEFHHEDVLVKSDPSFSCRIKVMETIAKAPVPEVRLAELFDTAMMRWYSNRYPEDYIESWHAFDERVHQGLDIVAQQMIQYLENLDQTLERQLDKHDPKPTIMVFTSGGVIATITAKLLNGDSMMAYKINKDLVNTGVTTLQMDSQHQLKLLTLNEHSHLFANGDNKLTLR